MGRRAPVEPHRPALRRGPGRCPVDDGGGAARPRGQGAKRTPTSTRSTGTSRSCPDTCPRTSGRISSQPTRGSHGTAALVARQSGVRAHSRGHAVVRCGAWQARPAVRSLMPTPREHRRITKALVGLPPVVKYVVGAGSHWLVWDSARGGPPQGDPALVQAALHRRQTTRGFASAKGEVGDEVPDWRGGAWQMPSKCCTDPPVDVMVLDGDVRGGNRPGGAGRRVRARAGRLEPPSTSCSSRQRGRVPGLFPPSPWRTSTLHRPAKGQNDSSRQRAIVGS